MRAAGNLQVPTNLIYGYDQFGGWVGVMLIVFNRLRILMWITIKFRVSSLLVL